MPRTVSFSGGTETEISDSISTCAASGTVFQRTPAASRGISPFTFGLKKQGIEYTASWSLDGTSWSNVGTHLFLNLNGREPTFSTASWECCPPEVGVRFDFVEIRRLP